VRLTKALTATAVSAAIAMALISAAPAMAASTALCKVPENPCKTKATLEKEKFKTPTENQIQTLHMTASAGSPWIWGPPLFSVICKNVLLEGKVEGLGNPLTISVKSLTYNECSLDGEGNNCEVKEEDAGITYTLNKTGENVGDLAVKGILQVHCVVNGSEVFDCTDELDGTTMTFKGRAGGKEHGMLIEDGKKLKTFGGTPCVDMTEGEEIFEGLLEPLEDVYVTT
jgi:hypothetical protein